MPTYAAGRSDGLGFEFGHQDLAVLVGHGGDDVDQFGRRRQPVLGRYLRLDLVQVDVAALVVRPQQLVDDVGDAHHLELLVGRPFRPRGHHVLDQPTVPLKNSTNAHTNMNGKVLL